MLSWTFSCPDDSGPILARSINICSMLMNRLRDCCMPCRCIGTLNLLQSCPDSTLSTVCSKLASDASSAGHAVVTDSSVDRFIPEAAAVWMGCAPPGRHLLMSASCLISSCTVSSSPEPAAKVSAVSPVRHHNCCQHHHRFKCQWASVTLQDAYRTNDLQSSN